MGRWAPIGFVGWYITRSEPFLPYFSWGGEGGRAGASGKGFPVAHLYFGGISTCLLSFRITSCSGLTLPWPSPSLDRILSV